MDDAYFGTKVYLNLGNKTIKFDRKGSLIEKESERYKKGHPNS